MSDERRMAKKGSIAHRLRPSMIWLSEVIPAPEITAGRRYLNRTRLSVPKTAGTGLNLHFVGNNLVPLLIILRCGNMTP
jgi:hypothetical protein